MILKLKDQGDIRKHGKIRKGGIIVEFAMLTIVIVGICVFFWNILSITSRQATVEQSINDVMLSMRDEMYTAKNINKNQDNATKLSAVIGRSTLCEKLGLDADQISATASKIALESLIQNKLYEKFADIGTRHLVNEKLGLSRDIGIKVNASDDLIYIELELDFKLSNILVDFKKYKSVSRHIIPLKDADKLLSMEKENDGSEKAENTIYYTQYGLNKTKVYHTHKDCFGLNMANTTKQLNVVSGAEVVVDGVVLHKCSFCEKR